MKLQAVGTILRLMEGVQEIRVFLFTYLPLISVLKNVCDSIANLENIAMKMIEVI